MGQSSNYAAAKDAQLLLSEEEFALGMGHSSNVNDATVMDALNMLRKEVFALDMGQRRSERHAASKGASSRSNGVGNVSSMVSWQMVTNYIY